MWMIAIREFFRVNWKWLVIGIVSVLVYFKATSWAEDYKQAKEDQARAVLGLALDKQAAELSNQSLQGTLLMLLEEKRKTEMLLLDALARQDAIRAEAKEQVDVFEEHDFPALVDAKPGLIEKLANKATNERLKEIEDALNR